MHAPRMNSTEVASGPTARPPLAGGEGVHQGAHPFELGQVGGGEGKLRDDLLDGTAGLPKGQSASAP